MMTAPSCSTQLQRVCGEVAELRSAVDEALYTAQEAIHRVQELATGELASHRGPSPPPGISEDTLHEHLCAFEAFIIGRVREENAEAAKTVRGAPAAPERSPSDATVAGRKVELQLEAQRTRTAAMEHRLGQLESKLNALMTDVVAQSQREAAHQRHLASMVHEHIETEVRAAGLTREAAAVPSSPPPTVVAVSVVEHVTAALAAMHDRVEEQHAELVNFQQQNYALVNALVKQLDKLKGENASLRQQLHGLQARPRQNVDAVGSCEEDESDAPIVWARSTR